ncbi:hypothetical protein [Phenylobacterium sp.]|uniref:hypothetical protein n=1 Tax=Phenylobacterium sp. TaxID=1871053 RepID=UPI0012030F86|nr:hypothetical protein [Phenylobacterium sp.]TAL37681.1 MAG: hypothetical protein EPN98_02740 [Phenylobacterium sp.]
MRLPIAALLALSVAAPAAAQPLSSQFQLDELRAQQEAAQRRLIDQSNQLMALEARLRAEQGAADLQRSAPRVSELRYEPSVRAAAVVTPAFPSISDAALAESNRRVQAAAGNRR